MNFEIYFFRHLQLHPSADACDLLKFCYQRAFGAEHLLRDLTAAKRYFDSEYAETEPQKGMLAEPLSDEIVRVHFAAWKAERFDAEALFSAFAASAHPNLGGRQLFSEDLKSVRTCLLHLSDRSLLTAWDAFLTQYDQNGCPMVRHSERFRSAEKPAYRIVRREQLDRLFEKYGKLNANADLQS